MKTKVNELFQKPLLKTIFNYLSIILLLGIGFYVGKMSHKLKPQKVRTEVNPFNNEFDTKTRRPYAIVIQIREETC